MTLRCLNFLRRLGAAGLALLAPLGCDELAYAANEAELLSLSAGAFVGAVEGADMVIGAVVEGDNIRLYTCAGPSQLESSRWFKGAVADAQFELDSGEWALTGARADGHLEGLLYTPDGEALPWSAALTAPGTHAGLYAAPTGSCTSGVVIQQDAPEGPLEARGTWCDGQGNFAQIIVLSPLVTSRGGIAVQIRRSSAPLPKAGDTFYVTPATP